jgi:hypothetical protein
VDLKFREPRGRPDPVDKYCDKAKAYEPHEAHPWEKREGFPFWCRGVLEEINQPPCQMIVDEATKRPCGDAAPVTIRVKTRLVDADIDVCPIHKARYDSESAGRRLPKAS